MKKYWWLIVIVLIFPIVINFVLRVSSPFQVIGDEKLWLSFWSSYGAVLATILVLFQNEKNNKETKAQQISIIKAQFRQKWLDDLIPILNRGINYIKITELGDIIICIKLETERVEMYIRNEYSRFISEPIELTLHLAARAEYKLDNKESDYVKYYTQISIEYGTFLSFGNKIFLLLSNSKSLESVNHCLESTIVTDKNIFTDAEIATLRSAQTIEDFVSKLHIFIIDRYLDFAKFYILKLTELRKAAHDMVTYETNKIMADIK